MLHIDCGIGLIHSEYERGIVFRILERVFRIEVHPCIHGLGQKKIRLSCKSSALLIGGCEDDLVALYHGRLSEFRWNRVISAGSRNIGCTKGSIVHFPQKPRIGFRKQKLRCTGCSVFLLHRFYRWYCSGSGTACGESNQGQQHQDCNDSFAHNSPLRHGSDQPAARPVLPISFMCSI